MANIHWLEPAPGTIHGSFSRELPPALEIESGDTVRLRTLDCDWGLEPRTGVRSPRRRFEPRLERDDGHALIGPIAVRGARPGSVLEVAVHALTPGPYGFTVAGGRRGAFGIDAEVGVADMPPRLLQWTLDRDAMVGRTPEGFAVPLRPFLGVMGMPPDEPGFHPSAPPRYCGGNIDCKELVAGTSLFLPIAVPGALLSVGDGHAAQGDGELCVNAIECPMDFVELTLRVHDDLTLALPRARTPSAWITFGFDADVDRAIGQAVSGMLDLMGERLGVTRTEALALASVAVDVRVTQVANGVRGAHAVLGHGAIHVPRR
jgi:acetamidase/formamidase